MVLFAVRKDRKQKAWKECLLLSLVGRSKRPASNVRSLTYERTHSSYYLRERPLMFCHLPHIYIFHRVRVIGTKDRKGVFGL